MNIFLAVFLSYTTIQNKRKKNVAKVGQKVKKKYQKKGKKEKNIHSFYLYNQKLQTETLRLTLTTSFHIGF